MTAIKQEDLIQSIADAFQYISYYHPLDYIKALGEAYEREESPAAKDAIAQILTNSRMAAEGHRPICQDTGIGVVFIKVGMQVTWPDATMSVQEMINEGVRRAYTNPDNPLRASVLLDPAGARKNSKDNTPAVVHFELVEGEHVEVILGIRDLERGLGIVEQSLAAEVLLAIATVDGHLAGTNPIRSYTPRTQSSFGQESCQFMARFSRSVVTWG